MKFKTGTPRPAVQRSHGGKDAGPRCDGRSRHDTAALRASQFAALWAAVAGVLAFVGNVSAADICFRPTASVSTSTVHLKDIAIVTASDPALMTRLENVALAPAPAPGRRMRLDFAEIRSRLEATGIPASELNYSGSSVVVVASADAPTPAKVKLQKTKPRVVVVAPGQVKRAEQIMTEAVRQSMRAKHRVTPTMFVEAVVDPADVPAVLASAAQGFEIGALDPKSTEPQAVQVGYQDSQGQPARFQVQCIISERPQVPVLAHSVSTGEVIHESDLAWKPVDSTEGLLTHAEQIMDKEAKKALHADEPIHADDIRSVPLVRANDIVTGVWHSGGIRITGQFKAKGDGGLGDVITLVKLTGRDQLTARVTDVHEAEIVSAEQAKSADRGDDGGDQGDEAPIRRGFARRSVSDPVPKPQQPIVNVAAPADVVKEQ
jgi:flagella basal body P-ring formation protein FlgA